MLQVLGPSRNQSLPVDQYCSISVSGGDEIRVIAEGKIEKKEKKTREVVED